MGGPALFWFTGQDTPARRRAAFAGQGVEVWTFAAAGGRIDLAGPLARAGSQGMTSILLEGGGQLAAAALKDRVVDQFDGFRCPAPVGGGDCRCGRPRYNRCSGVDPPRGYSLASARARPALHCQCEVSVFTGLVEEIGRVASSRRRGAFQRLEIGAARILDQTKVGDSININGACQTVVALNPASFVVESVQETLERTTLGRLEPGSPVNLERALRLGDRLGGHLVQGHVDGVGRLTQLERAADHWLLKVIPPVELAGYIAAKGSITVDGISLTVAQIGDEGFTVAVIPHTFEHTALSSYRAPVEVNLEVDVIARYIERLMAVGAPPQGRQLSLEHLRDMGY